MTKGNDTHEAATAWVGHAGPALHDVETRAGAPRVASEILRLNEAVRNVSDGRPHFLEQPGDYLALLNASPPPAAATSQAAPGKGSAVRDDVAPPSASVAAAAARLRRGETTSLALTEAALERARQTQPIHNAFIALDADRALDAARRLDEEAARGRWRGPLHGIPMAHKDCFSRRGRPMTVGGKVVGDGLGEHDAVALSRLDEAGSVNIGALNLNEMVCGPTGQNPHHGDCCNALDPERISGGSSSGSAVAVATGCVYAALGSDTGGSTRLPASMNGLFGMKPTYGLVSRTGSFPRAFSLDAIGPIAHTAEDCAMVLQAVAGHDPRDPTSLRVPVPDYSANLRADWIGDTRLGVLRLDTACDPQIERVFEDFLLLAEADHPVERDLAFDEMEASYALGDVVSKVEAATLHGAWMRSHPQDYSQAVFARTEPGLHVPAVRYLEALWLRAKVLRAFLSGPLAHADVLLCPTVPMPVPLRTEADMEKPDAVFGVVSAITRLTRAFSYLGVPVLSMPIGLDSNNMPVGVQLIGRPLDEARLLGLAHRLSLKTGWKVGSAVIGRKEDR